MSTNLLEPPPSGEPLPAGGAPLDADALARRVREQETQITELTAILEVGHVLTGLLDMEDVLSYVVYLAESLVAGHAAAVALVSEDGTEMLIKNATGTMRAAEGGRRDINRYLLGWVVLNNQSVLTPCLSDDPRGVSFATRQGPAVVVPITISGKVIGSFMVARAEGSPPFTEEHQAILQKMSVHAAIAITNAEIHRRQQAVAATLRQQAAALESAYNDLHLSQQQLLVSEKMAALGRITAGIAHEINSPLGGILNALRAARGFVDEYRSSAGDPEVTAEDHHAIAEDILNALGLADSAVQKVAQFVRSIKGQTRMGEAQTSEFDPAQEIDATLVLLQHEMKRRRIGVFTELQRGLHLTGDAGKFAMVIQNLVSNAADAYGDAPGEIWVRVAGKDDRVVVRVEDQGSGIPEEIRGRIFDYLFTTKEVGKGTGLGLAMVHSVVTTSFGGEVTLETEVGRGTAFILSIPLTPIGDDHGA